MSDNLQRLLSIMVRLRDPETGCPWDIEQTFSTIAPHTIEEAYEVADAIQVGDLPALRDELGDLLLQVVYHARIAEEQGAFDFEGVAGAISDKMIARHPHVFGADSVASAEAQTRRWEEHKAAERARKAAAEGRMPSALDGVTLGLPALTRAVKLQKRAARTGFEWTRPADLLDKVEEEVREIRMELTGHGPDFWTEAARDPDGLRARVFDELGDALFCLANLARGLDLDPEAALRHANAKFERRFRGIEAKLAQEGLAATEVALGELLELWAEVKREERRDADTAAAKTVRDREENNE